jgi:hypothetical protein
MTPSATGSLRAGFASVLFAEAMCTPAAKTIGPRTAIATMSVTGAPERLRAGAGE